MTEGRRFSKESSIYVVGEFLSRSLTFILLPIYAVYLSEEDFAVLSLVAMIWPVMLIVIGQGFSAYIFRGYFDYSDKKRFFGTILIFSMALGFVTAFGIHLIGPWLFDRIFKEIDYKPYLQYGVVFAVFRLFFNHVVSLYRAKREALTSVMLSFVLFFAQFASVLVAIYLLRTDLLGILKAQIVGYIFVSVVYAMKMYSDIDFHFQSEVIRPCLSFVYPLYVHAIASWAVVYISRIFIERDMSLVDLATFSVASQIAMILSVINVGLNQAWAPFVYSNVQKNDFMQLFTVNSRKLVVFIVLLSGCIILFTREMLLLMQKAAYLSAQGILPILMLAYFFQLIYFIYVAIIVYNKNTKILSVISVGSGAVCVLLNAVLVPLWGMVGAAFCTAVSFFLMLVLVRGVTKKYIRVRLINWRIWVFIFCVCAAVGISYFWIDPMALPYRIVLKLLIVFGLLRMLGVLKLFNIKDFFATFFQK
ncbi:MAG: oligosaccharide flippase family protein [bacterium]